MIDKKQRINQEITAREVRLIDDMGKPLGIVNIDQAKYLAFVKEMDLVEVGASANPPVCKIQDYGKFVYEKTKQAQKQKAKQKGGETKEISLGVNIDTHDLQVKVKKGKEFLEDKNKLLVSVKLKGRENIFADRAHTLIEQYRELVDAKYEQRTKRLGSKIFATMKK